MPLTTSVPVALVLSVELAATELEGLPKALAEELMRALLLVVVRVVPVVAVAAELSEVWGAVVVPVAAVVSFSSVVSALGVLEVFKRAV